MNVEVRGSASLMRKLDNLSKVAQAKLLERAVIAGALIVQNDAKVNCPYVSRNLARSIHIGGHEDQNPDNTYQIVQRGPIPVPGPKVGEHTVGVSIGTDVEYAWSVEYGTSETTGRKPFLRPALDENERQVQREIGAALHDLIKAAL